MSLQKEHRKGVYYMRVRGRLIRAVRNKKNLSQSDLANEICTQSTISNIEKKAFVIMF